MRNALFRAASLLIAAVVLPSRLQSQGDPPFHVFGLATGATAMSVSAINSQLSPAGFAGLSSDGVSYGISGHYAFGRALLGADAARTTFGEEGMSNGRTDDLSSLFALGTAAYAVIVTRTAQFYPQVGVGLGHFDVTLRDRNGGNRAASAEPTFAELAQSPGSASMVSGSHLLFSVGAGADMLLSRTSTGDAGVVFGVRAGILVAPNRTTWMSEGRTVIAGPDASAGGPFLRVIVGIGGR